MTSFSHHQVVIPTASRNMKNRFSKKKRKLKKKQKDLKRCTDNKKLMTSPVVMVAKRYLHTVNVKVDRVFCRQIFVQIASSTSKHHIWILNHQQTQTRDRTNLHIFVIKSRRQHTKVVYAIIYSIFYTNL